MDNVTKVDNRRAMVEILQGTGDAAERLGFPGVRHLLHKMAKGEPILRIAVNGGIVTEVHGLPELGSLLVMDYDIESEDPILAIVKTAEGDYNVSPAKADALFPEEPLYV